MNALSCFEGPDGWMLAPEGAAIRRNAKTAVIADVHLGYEWARGHGGDCIPAHSLAETLGLLASLLQRITIDRLIVAGDLVESRQFCRRTNRDVETLTDWLSWRGVTLQLLAGNHDPPRRPPLPATCEIEGWTIGHGHEPIVAARTIRGHHHPALRAEGLIAPCFLVDASTIVLPAFSPNAAGAGLAAVNRALGVGRLSCVASSGGAMFDFGPVDRLLRTLGESQAETQKRGVSPVRERRRVV